MYDKSDQGSQMKYKQVMNEHLALTMASNGDNDLYHQRRNEREKIRKKLAAIDSDNEDLCTNNDFRTTTGVNLQICFINDINTAENAEKVKIYRNTQNLKHSRFSTPIENNIRNVPSCRPTQSFPYWQRPSFFFNRQLKLLQNQMGRKKDRKPLGKEDMVSYHARLQLEVRTALSQAKDMARMQVMMERQQRKFSPLSSLIGVAFPEGWCRLNREILNNMNLAQIQVIVNDLHSQIENLNDELVKLLLERDDLHMEQDSMLVDIEDLTQHLGLKGSREDK